jgi:hypothetical protein
MLNKNTFGDSRCEIVLVELLNEINEDKLTRYVSKGLNKYSTVVKKLQHLDSQMRLFLYCRLCEYAEDQFTKSLTLKKLYNSDNKHIKVLTFYKNAVKKKLKSLLK